ncbi:TPA: hypothetical protein HA234_07300 [Candidatus Woesearchaeota archaeon]|nr:hypothetical protein [Candidatus Woesearchaeota archaeon]
MHELLHACMHEAKLNYDLDEETKKVDEEDVVNRLTPVLLKTLKINKIIN